MKRRFDWVVWVNGIALSMSLVATLYLTVMVLLFSLGVKQVCFYEHMLFVSILEVLIGVFVIIVQIKLMLKVLMGDDEK